MSMLVMICASFSNSFKYFHTTDIFAGCISACLYLIVTSLFGTINSVFLLIRPNNFVCLTIGAFLVNTSSRYIIYTGIIVDGMIWHTGEAFPPLSAQTH